MREENKKLQEKDKYVHVIMNNLRIKWALVLVIWQVVGIYCYNIILEKKNILTEVLFLAITIFIAWRNKRTLKPFFENPFCKSKSDNPYSNILWVYPFCVLLISAILVMVANGIGLIPSDPQNIDEMTISVREYIENLITLPILVFEEEACNTILLIIFVKLFSKLSKHNWTLAAAIIFTSVFFGALHISAWNVDAAISRMIIHLPFIFSILYLKTAWVSVLAHFYQNFLTYTSIIYPGFSTYFVSYGLLLLLIIFGYRQVVRYVRDKRES